MINYKKILILSAVILLISSHTASAQTCGFGCLGLSGFYAGYSYQQYEADALNQNRFRVNSAAEQFGTAKGFRLGANLFRTKYKGVLLTFKGYYQFLNEQKNVSNPPQTDAHSFEHSLDLNYWAIGFDAGLNLMKYVDFKAVDAQVTFHKAKLTVKEQQDLLEITENVYRSRKTKLGVQLGSGFIFHLAGDYISLETTAAYSIFSVGTLEDENGNFFNSPDPKTEPEEKLINKGGLTLLVQLNIGIPIY